MAGNFQGFVMIPREILQLPIWGNTTDVAVWLYCYLNASHSAYKSLKPGQFYTSKEIMAKNIGISRNTVIRSLRSLVAKKLLEVEVSKHGTHITVCFWEELKNGAPCGIPGYVYDAVSRKDFQVEDVTYFELRDYDEEQRRNNRNQMR